MEKIDEENVVVGSFQTEMEKKYKMRIINGENISSNGNAIQEAIKRACSKAINSALKEAQKKAIAFAVKEAIKNGPCACVSNPVKKDKNISRVITKSKLQTQKKEYKTCDKCMMPHKYKSSKSMTYNNHKQQSKNMKSLKSVKRLKGVKSRKDIKNKCTKSNKCKKCQKKWLKRQQ